MLLEGKCYSIGTIERTAQGQCLCQTNFVGPQCNECAQGFEGSYQGFEGSSCHQCKPGYHLDDNNTCQYGNCQSPGTQMRQENGVCLCNTGYTGSQCNICDNGFHMVSNTCFVGECNPLGITLVEEDGTCQCLDTFQGGMCDECRYGHVGVDCSQCDTGFIMDKITHLCEGERLFSTLVN